jgi:hypothetical protein
MKNSKKELIIKGFQYMDCDMLDILLEDNKTYQDATKKVFIEKINEAFSKLKKFGDTFLIPYQGFCNYQACNNRGCRGYSFVGNKSNKHIDLIFEELDNDVNDIYHCNGFKNNDISVETENLISIDIKNDEKADFKPSFDFLIKSQKCKLAYEELTQYQATIIDKDVYLVWLEKFYQLYKSFNPLQIPYVEFNKFYWLYYRINELKDFLETSDYAKEAVKEFQTIEKSNEPQLLKWLIKYEKTADNLTLFLYEDLDIEYPEKSEYFEVDVLKINTSDFIHIAKFKFLFDEHYWIMLEKYTTSSTEETTRYINENGEMTNFNNSLTYHIDKRGIQL